MLIFKSKEDPKNCMPVSVTSVLGKVMEIILGGVEKHLEDNTVTGNSQHSFLKVLLVIPFMTR